jgi:hypothetical protein
VTGRAGTVAGATAGALVSAALPVTGFGAVVWVLDGSGLRALAARARARFARTLA